MKNLFKINYLDSINLAKVAFNFLCQHKVLNLFIMLNLFNLVGAIVLVFALWPGQLTLPFTIVGILIYLLAAFLFNYLNAALSVVTIKFLNNEPTSPLVGFHYANQRLYSILQWSLIISTVGLIASLLESLKEIVEKLLSTRLSVSWNNMSYFILPILTMEKVSLWTAIVKSKEAIGSGWHNTVSVKTFVILFYIVSLLLVSEFYITSPSALLEAIDLLTPLFLVIYLLAVGLETVVIGALYINHVQLRQPKYFDSILLNRAFAKEEK